ncbi:hypothetical protein SUGI_0980800 [Cryptomeria japonica]|uniref:uncharacterized protein LOC131064644 n=1 Tax=Cryptomeria japonica TaxID=3369 RepID=UPI0024149D95|nr:uncharacterized protein LOC131064644 [Cryptomeria japonica]GLJ46539.1 hypothetical protein SUGI_0980800 [Cryptomeria japonica]
MMAAIFKSSGVECTFSLAPHPNKTWRRNNIVGCNAAAKHSQRENEVVFRRRQMLLASTSVRMPAPLVMPSNEASNLTDLHKLQAAQKLKFNYSSNVDVASLFSSSNSCKGTPGEFSGMVSVPSQHYCLGNYDFVQAKVTMPGFGRKSRADLVIEGIKVEREKPLCFDVYIRPACREEDDEYAGSFIHIPPRQNRNKGICRCSLRLEISDILHDFDFNYSEHHTSVIVTLVPKFNTDQLPIAAENICIQKA